MTQSVKRRLLRTSILAGFAAAAFSAAPAWAQAGDEAEETQPAAQAGQTDDRILVTGSRIATASNLTAPNPVSMVTADDIEMSGQTDIVNFLRDVPALFTSLPANQSARNAGTPLGTSLLNLRGLGTNRTLVLINGRRNVSGVAGTAAVDISSIPAALIERVDVLTGGASAIYGADGVSGVVNFILRDNFEGFDYRGRASFTEAGGGEEYQGSVTGGANFANGRGNVVASAELTHVGSIDAAQRSGFAGRNLASFMPTNAALSAFLGINPNAANTFATNRTLPVSSPNGIIFLEDANDRLVPGFSAVNILFPGRTVGSGQFPVTQIIDNNGVLRPFDRGDFFVNLFEAVGGDGIAATPNVIELQPQTRRVSLNGNLNYEIHDRINFFAETRFSYMETESRNQVNGFNDDIPISVDNPFIPAALREQINSLQAEGITPSIVVSRDNLDVPALSSADQHSFRIVTGFEGELGAGWEYTLSYTLGRTDRTFTNEKARVEDRFFAAVDAVVDPATGNVVCRSDLDPNAIPPVAPFPNVREGFLTFTPGDGQCSPINIFGRGTTSPEAEAFIFQSARSKSQMTQQVINGFVTGDSSALFSLPAGPIGVAGGFEYRVEESSFAPSELENAGLLFNTVTTRSEPVTGRFHVWEGFGEVNVPLIADRPFFEELSAIGAVRFADYSTVGSNTSWSFGGVWSPNSDIRFRGTYGRAVRAPNINELFSPPQPIFIGAAQDPCNENLIDAGSEFRRANCEILVGPNFDSTQFVSAFITGRAGGNPDLNEERASTLTFGGVLTPSLVPGLSVTVDYYEVKIDDAISSIPGITVIQNCVDAPTLDNDFCPLVDRDPVDGFITFFRSGQQNVSKLEASGVDFDVNYRFDLEDVNAGLAEWGAMNLRLSGTRNLRRRDFQFQDFPDEFEDVLGEFLFPKWVFNANATWIYNDLSVTWRTTYQSSQLLPGVSNQDIEGNPNFVDPLQTGDAFVHHLSASYDLRDNLRINAGINNVADRDPFLGTVTRPFGFAGRSFFVGVTGSF
jgi:iron complex outermembrane receptor protein